MNTLDSAQELLDQRYKMTNDSDAHKQRIEQLEDYVKFYQSEETHLVLLVHDLYENPMYFKDHQELMFHIDDSMLFDGLNYRVEVVEMTGVEFGQLLVSED